MSCQKWLNERIEEYFPSFSRVADELEENSFGRCHARMVLFDCMIFLQAAAKPSGPAAALLELVEIGELELFVSEACLEQI